MRNFDVKFSTPDEQGRFTVGIGKYIRFDAVGADKLENSETMDDMRSICNQRAAMIMEAGEGCSVHYMDGANGERVEISAQEVKADLALHELPSVELSGRENDL
jgi:hypothetical protein